MSSPLLSVKNLIKYYRNPNSIFSIKDKWIKAVDGVTFEIYPGETVGIVGESGCGKSTLGRTIVGLNKQNSGEIYFLGEDILNMSEYSRKKLSKKMQIIFQDPAGSLNPRRTIEETLMDPFSIHGLYEKSERKEIIKEQIIDVGLDLYHLDRYPHELSGGQKQRVGIARALAMKPEFIICDEPVSALGVSVQAQIINLFQDMNSRFANQHIAALVLSSDGLYNRGNNPLYEEMNYPVYTIAQGDTSFSKDVSILYFNLEVYEGFIINFRLFFNINKKSKKIKIQI